MRGCEPCTMSKHHRTPMTIQILQIAAPPCSSMWEASLRHCELLTEKGLAALVPTRLFGVFVLDSVSHPTEACIQSKVNAGAHD